MALDTNCRILVILRSTKNKSLSLDVDVRRRGARVSTSFSFPVHVHTVLKLHYWTITLVVSQTSTLITGESSLIPSSSRCSTILGYVANLLAISALYSARSIMVKFALVAQRNMGMYQGNVKKWKRAKDAAYHKENMLLCKQVEAGVQLNAEQADWKDDTDDEFDDQELEAHYMYMAQIQEVTPDAVDTFGPIFDAEPLHKVQNNNDNYNVFAIENEHPEQPESVNDIYLEKKGDTNITIDSLDICYDREQDDQDDTDELA
ncbi:hypothetical protein Tco_0475800 [Tanacetum coccineum]